MKLKYEVTCALLLKIDLIYYKVFQLIFILFLYTYSNHVLITY